MKKASHKHEYFLIQKEIFLKFEKKKNNTKQNPKMNTKTRNQYKLMNSGIIQY